MQEVKCSNCQALLCKADQSLDLEIVCRFCHSVNYWSEQNGSAIGLRGGAFSKRSVRVRDPLSNSLLLQAIGIGRIEIPGKPKKTIWQFDISCILGSWWKQDKKTVICNNVEQDEDT